MWWMIIQHNAYGWALRRFKYLAERHEVVSRHQLVHTEFSRPSGYERHAESYDHRSRNPFLGKCNRTFGIRLVFFVMPGEPAGYSTRRHACSIIHVSD